jgi:CTP synthase
MRKINNATTGQVYSTVLERERRGDYLGATIQVIPHITDEIIARIKAINKPKKFDVVICEVGGTVGDIESLPFMEAIRQLSLEVGYHNHTMMHVTLVPYIQASEELKTKPTQHSVMKLREIGLSPDMILCRTDHKLTKDVRNKIGLFGNLNPDHVIEGSEVKSIYEVPLTLYNQNVSEIIMDRLQLPGRADVSYLKTFIKKYKDPKYNVNIAMCGKYTELPDAYKSVLESFIHSGVENNARVNIHWVATEEIKNDSDAEKAFSRMDGILLLPGFGSRGSEGKIISCKYARENNVPFLGICLGLQCAVIEFARNVCGLNGANSTEFNKKTPYPVIDLMESQKAIKAKGGTMRSITGYGVFLLNSVLFAPLRPQTFRANSITAHCSPKQIPRKGTLFSLAYLHEIIFPSDPLDPKPGKSRIPSILLKAFSASESFFISSVATQ